MNQIVVVGQVRKPPEVYERTMTVYVQYTKDGRGRMAGQVFTRLVKVLVFGQDVAAHAASFQVGDVVMATGEAEAEAYIKDGEAKPRAIIKIIGNLHKVGQDSGLVRPESPPSPPLPED